MFQSKNTRIIKQKSKYLFIEIIQIIGSYFICFNSNYELIALYYSLSLSFLALNCSFEKSSAALNKSSFSEVSQRVLQLGYLF